MLLLAPVPASPKLLSEVSPIFFVCPQISLFWCWPLVAFASGGGIAPPGTCAMLVFCGRCWLQLLVLRSSVWAVTRGSFSWLLAAFQARAMLLFSLYLSNRVRWRPSPLLPFRNDCWAAVLVVCCGIVFYTFCIHPLQLLLHCWGGCWYDCWYGC